MDSKNIIFFMFIGMVSAQTENSLSDALNKLPPELQGKVDETQITEIKNKTISVFKKKCEENAGPEAYNKAEKALTQFNDCLQSLVDTEKLQQEIEDAKPTGQVDEVFKKYCQKTPQFKNCFKNITDTVKPCFSVDEQKHLKTIYNISEQLAEFVCFKEGDRIALFISEHGPECIKEKQPEIEKCLNSTLGTEMSFNTNNMSLDNIPTIKFEEKECNQLEDLQVCVVAALEKCSAPTSANIVESLFKFARKATPCKDIPEEEEANMRNENSTAEETNATKEPNSASGLVAKSLAMTAIALALLM